MRPSPPEEQPSESHDSPRRTRGRKATDHTQSEINDQILRQKIRLAVHDRSQALNQVMKYKLREQSALLQKSLQFTQREYQKQMNSLRDGYESRLQESQNKMVSVRRTEREVRTLEEKAVILERENQSLRRRLTKLQADVAGDRSKDLSQARREAVLHTLSSPRRIFVQEVQPNSSPRKMPQIKMDNATVDLPRHTAPHQLNLSCHRVTGLQLDVEEDSSTLRNSPRPMNNSQSPIVGSPTMDSPNPTTSDHPNAEVDKAARKYAEQELADSQRDRDRAENELLDTQSEVQRLLRDRVQLQNRATLAEAEVVRLKRKVQESRDVSEYMANPQLRMKERDSARYKNESLMLELKQTQNELVSAKKNAAAANWDRESVKRSLQKEVDLTKQSLHKEMGAHRASRSLLAQLEAKATEQKRLMRKSQAGLSQMKKLLWAFRQRIEVDSTCVGCVGLLIEPRILVPCGHTVCRKCNESMLRESSSGDTDGTVRCIVCAREADTAGFEKFRFSYPNKMLEPTITRAQATSQEVDRLLSVLRELEILFSDKTLS